MAKGLLVKFYMDAVHLKAQSEAEGRPIFEDREFVEIIPIGDTKTVVTKPVTDIERQRFPEEYAAFKRGIEQTFAGTPLNQWPIMLPAQIKLLNHFNVYTVEQLADLDDIANLHLIGRDIDPTPIHLDMAVIHKLARGEDGRHEFGAIDDSIEATFQEPDKIIA